MADKLLKLLLVEDNPGDARLIQIYLSEAPGLNIKLYLVESLAAANGKIAETEIDVMLLDLGLPDSNGLETFTSANRDNPEVPIVVLTGHADTDLGATAVLGGAQDYLVKGQVDGNILSHALRYAIERKRASLELEQAYTALKETQAHLVQSEKMAGIGTLATGVAHEINNPLQVVIGMTEEIAYGDNLEQIHEDAREVLEATERIRKTVDELTYYSHDAQTLDEIKPVDLNLAIRKSLKMAKYIPGFKRLRLTTELSATSPIHANPGKLQQVFTNLITNAVAAMPEGGELTLTTDHHDDHVRVRIRDAGSGIPAEKRSKIFDPFFTTKKKGEGTGLGLYIVHQIVTKHNGDIVLASCEGEGTTFTITFPLAQEG